jgi:transposase
MLMRSQKAPHRQVVRARIALLATKGMSLAAIARAASCDLKTARKWRGRFAATPSLHALKDAPRSGRPARVSIANHQQLIKLACDRTTDDKSPFRQIWTLRSLADAHAIATGIELSKSEVSRILNGADLRPHRIRLWLHSPDPDFQPKVEAICRLYLEPPLGATVVCVDEKPGMQALEHRYPMKPARSCRSGRREFEYVRHGTRTLIASFNTRTGEILGSCGPTRTAVDLVAFMERLAVHHPTGPVFVIWDNLNIHRGDRWKAFNMRHGERFRFVHTPLHASWLNQIEVWFSILARRVLRHRSFRSLTELQARVEAFIAHWNEIESHPFRWTFRGRWRNPPSARAA